MMDYVSNKNGTIAREKGTDHASVLLAYDMLLTATRNNKKKSGKEKEKHEAAEKLSYYKVSDGSCKTNESGVAQIKNLKTGVYLLYVSDQKNYEEITPVLIAVPTWGEEEGTMLYDVKVYPKHTPLPKENETPTIETVKTGDSQELWKYVTVLGVAMGITIGILGWKKRRMK